VAGRGLEESFASDNEELSDRFAQDTPALRNLTHRSARLYYSYNKLLGRKSPVNSYHARGISICPAISDTSTTGFPVRFSYNHLGIERQTEKFPVCERDCDSYISPYYLYFCEMDCCFCSAASRTGVCIKGACGPIGTLESSLVIHPQVDRFHESHEVL
jgi:hypothetical protein